VFSSMSRPSTVVDRIAGLLFLLILSSFFFAPVSTGLLSSLLALSVVEASLL
jgi:hypothetical protein